LICGKNFNAPDVLSGRLQRTCRDRQRTVHHRAKFMTGLRQRCRVSAFVARHASPPCGSRPGVKSHLEIMQLRRSLATSPFATGALRTTETTGRTLDQDQD
jgi:hypothetical protein